VAELVSRLLATAASDISQKYKMGNISKGVAKNTPARQKNIQKTIQI
jgi:hypothetical protein